MHPHNQSQIDHGVIFSNIQNIQRNHRFFPSVGQKEQLIKNKSEDSFLRCKHQTELYFLSKLDKTIGYCEKIPGVDL